jgi:hypothetical protein
MRARSLFLQARMTYCIIQTKTHDNGSLHHKHTKLATLFLSETCHVPIFLGQKPWDTAGNNVARCWHVKYMDGRKVMSPTASSVFPLSRTRSSAHSTYSYFLSWLLLPRLILLLQRHSTFPRKVGEFLQQHTGSHSRLKFPSYSLLQ